MKILPINNFKTNYLNKTVNAKPNVSNALKSVFIPGAILAVSMIPFDFKAQAKDNIQYEKEFVMDGKNYKMIYTNNGFENEAFAVSEIQFVQKKNKARLEELIKYSDDKICAKVSEKNGIKEIILPQEIGKELIDLYEGKTNLYVIPGINTYTDK